MRSAQRAGGETQILHAGSSATIVQSNRRIKPAVALLKIAGHASSARVGSHFGALTLGSIRQDDGDPALSWMWSPAGREELGRE